MRLISLILIVTALMLLGADAVTSLEKGGELTVRSLGMVWAIARRRQRWTPSRTGCRTMLPSWRRRLFLPGAAGWAATGVLGVILAFVFGVATDRNTGVLLVLMGGMPRRTRTRAIVTALR